MEKHLKVGILWKKRMETSPVTCRTLEESYHIDRHAFEKQYKEVLSGYRKWEQLAHAGDWLWQALSQRMS